MCSAWASLLFKAALAITLKPQFVASPEGVGFKENPSKTGTVPNHALLLLFIAPFTETVLSEHDKLESRKPIKNQTVLLLEQAAAVKRQMGD